ncbi:exodeoxyribonuclease VII small subunit [candidate division WOR-3 bacterium]|nr:exodeoxyribonuclease VII small subunit [candidate division WOR-3 bacterium]
MSKSDKPTESLSFEQALAELESIVKQMEAGNLTLEQSLALFERGVQLARACKVKLAEAELKVSQLVKDKQGLLAEEPFAEEKG